MSEVRHGLKRVTRQSLRQALAHFSSGYTDASSGSADSSSGYKGSSAGCAEPPRSHSPTPTTDAPSLPPPSEAIELMDLDELLSLEGYLHKHAVSTFLFARLPSHPFLSHPLMRSAALPKPNACPPDLLLSLSLVWKPSGRGQGSVQPCVWWCACAGGGLGVAVLALPLPRPTRQAGPPLPTHIPRTGTTTLTTPSKNVRHVLNLTKRV